ncbi:MAG: hypothetical protein HYU69_06900 [Bacteroidetes bacterium]|nr:hypothetical protein [Bacteroidota bacterium]
MNHSFTVKVLYDESLEDMLIAAKLTHITPDITSKNFPPSIKKGEITVELVIVDLKKKMKRPDLIKELAAKGLRLATLPELLALTRDYYDELKDINRLVAPGSLWGIKMAYLSGGGKSIAWCTKEWRDWYTCLAAKL